ncbi:HDOD domain-containing protein [Desulfosarcina sp. BuS5]|uniref:HDOD domain-containing protein n=2 Tax=Desulfosarcina sp. BuS5 TaxID=933262 RepID=UPI0006843693|nr:HDOD domain-containing protein [Desulfosarcina sp. BuS5]
MKKMEQAKLNRIIRKIEDLPTLPRTVLRITELVNNPRTSAQDLAGVVVDDQVLTARLLRLVNSSFYGFPRKVSTVTGAIVLLGFDAIRNLLLTTSILELFSNKKRKTGFNREKLWDHSIGCAVGAKIIGSYLKYERIEELFVSGILHDIGKIVEMLFLPEDFAQIVSIVEKDNILLFSAEERVLGYTHADIGRLLAQRWSLPAKIEAVIANHHQPDAADGFMLEAAIIHLADILCRALDIGSGGDNRIPPLNKNAWEVLELNISVIEPIMHEIETEFDSINLSITA